MRVLNNNERYLTDTTFRVNLRNQNFYSLAGNIGYYVTSDAKVYLEGVWNRITNKKSRLSAYDYGDGSSVSLENSSGMEDNNFMPQVGLENSF